MRYTSPAIFGPLAFGAAAFAAAQDYPVKPLRLITTEVGGTGDAVARLLTSSISGPLGQQVIVDNRSAILGIEAVAKSAPDGYTLLLPGGVMWIGPLLQTTSYDPLKDFAPISLLIRQPNILTVHPSLPVRSVQDLIRLAKARPGELAYGSAPAGGSTHLAAELFKHMAGVDILRVPYKGTGPAFNALLGGEVQIMFATAGVVLPQVKTGRLRAVAVTTPEPTVLAPGLQTVAASGVPGYESASMLALFAPVRTPATVVNRLNREVVQVLGRPDIREKLLALGMESAGGTPDELHRVIASEIGRISKVLRTAPIRE